MIYVVHAAFKRGSNPHRMDPVHDLAPALKHLSVRVESVQEAKELGLLAFMNVNVAMPGSGGFDAREALKRARRELAKFCKYLTDTDHLLLIGDPVLIGIASIAAFEACHVVNFLRYDRSSGQYESIRLDDRDHIR